MNPDDGQDGAATSTTAELDARSLLRRPSAFVPPLLSLVACALVVGYVAYHGATGEADEGAAAHLWQLLMVAQIPVSGFFLIKWLPRAPRPARLIIALHLAAALVALAPVYFLHL